MDRRSLGTTEIQLSAIGLGCWQFSEGKGLVGRFWEPIPEDVVREIVRASLEGGVNWFDTAEAYGKGASERGLSRALRTLEVKPDAVVVATKWSPVFRTARSISGTIQDRLGNLSPYPIGLHQVHSPLSVSSVRAQMNAMANLMDEGAIRTAGVSNFTAGMMRRAHAALGALGHPLVANQVHYHLLHRNIERNGVMRAAKELGITIIAYSPLGQGVLTGRYHDDPRSIQDRPGPRKRMSAFQEKGLARTRPLLDLLRTIGERHDATPAQVALNWLCTFHGDTVVAIPGARTPDQARENAGAMNLTLSGDEMEDIDRVSREVS